MAISIPMVPYASNKGTREEETEVRVRDPRHVLCKNFVVDDATAKDDSIGTSSFMV